MFLILDSEHRDFKHCIDAADLYINDFELTERPHPDGPKEGYFPTGMVTVTYKPTGIARTYHAAGVSTWSTQFERDLKDNVFKTR